MFTISTFLIGDIKYSYSIEYQKLKLNKQIPDNTFAEVVTEL